MSDDEVPDPISAVFRRTKADGSYYYTDVEVRHYVPLMIVTLKLPPDALSADSLQLFATFMDAVKHDMPDAEMTPATVFAYYEKHPVNAELAREMKAAFRKVGAEPQGDDDSLDRLVATTRTRFEAREAPKPGQVRAGPLARFTADPKKTR